MADPAARSPIPGRLSDGAAIGSIDSFIRIRHGPRRCPARFHLPDRRRVTFNVTFDIRLDTSQSVYFDNPRIGWRVFEVARPTPKTADRARNRRTKIIAPRPPIGHETVALY